MTTTYSTRRKSHADSLTFVCRLLEFFCRSLDIHRLIRHLTEFATIMIGVKNDGTDTFPQFPRVRFRLPVYVIDSHASRTRRNSKTSFSKRGERGEQKLKSTCKWRIVMSPPTVRWPESSGSIASGEEKIKESGILGLQAFVQKPSSPFPHALPPCLLSSFIHTSSQAFPPKGKGITS
jgi:hypothetical protein